MVVVVGGGAEIEFQNFENTKKIWGGGQPISLSPPLPLYYVLCEDLLTSLGTIITMSRHCLRGKYD